jgi:hypothetical protein
MGSGRVDGLGAAVDALAGEDVEGVSLAADLVELHRLRARLDAEISRRVRAFDVSASGPSMGRAVRRRGSRRGVASRRCRRAVK